jgi:chromosome segregation ATPase
MSSASSHSQSEDIVIVESSDYAQVIFDDVHETYSNLKPLECSFTLNELLRNEESSDWVGIYKVGFSDCSQYVCNFPITLSNEIKGNILFPVDALPKDDGEFYQFVYVSNAKQIRGASVPFQFKTGQCTEVSDDEDQDAVVVKFDNNDTITEIKNKCVELSVANNSYQKVLKENETVIKGLKDDVASIKLRCFRLTMDNEKLNFTLRNKADSLKNLAETITSLTADNNNLKQKFEALSGDNKTLLDSLQQRITQVSVLENELESVKNNKEDFEGLISVKETELVQLEKDKDELNRIVDELNLINDQLNKLDAQVVERTTELEKIKEELQKNNIIVNEQAEKIKEIINEKQDLSDQIVELTHENGLLLAGQQNMIHELDMSKEKLVAAEQSKEVLRTQLDSVSNELLEAQTKLAAQTDIATELAVKLNQNNSDSDNFELKLKNLKE